MTNQIKIEKAMPLDAKELNALVNFAYRGEESKKGWTTEAGILDGIRINEAALEALLLNPGIMIMKSTDAGGTILGTVCLEVKARDLYLGLFAVSPLSQGSGIGKSLLRAAEGFALDNDCSRILISVISTRVELIEWYKRHGYISTGGAIAFEEIEGRFGDPKVEDISLIEMEKVVRY